MTRPRLVPRGHPDRTLSTEEVIEPAYQALVLRMMSKGMDQREVVLAIESLAQAHLDTFAANAATEAEIGKARREAGLPGEDDLPPPPRQAWMYAAGAAMWGVLLFSAAFLAGGWLLRL